MAVGRPPTLGVGGFAPLPGSRGSPIFRPKFFLRGHRSCPPPVTLLFPPSYLPPLPGSSGRGARPAKDNIEWLEDEGLLLKPGDLEDEEVPTEERDPPVRERPLPPDYEYTPGEFMAEGLA